MNSRPYEQKCTVQQTNYTAIMKSSTIIFRQTFFTTQWIGWMKSLKVYIKVLRSWTTFTADYIGSYNLVFIVGFLVITLLVRFSRLLEGLSTFFLQIIWNVAYTDILY